MIAAAGMNESEIKKAVISMTEEFCYSGILCFFTFLNSGS